MHCKQVLKDGPGIVNYIVTGTHLIFGQHLGFLLFSYYTSKTDSKLFHVFLICPGFLKRIPWKGLLKDRTDLIIYIITGISSIYILKHQILSFFIRGSKNSWVYNLHQSTDSKKLKTVLN